MILSGMASLSPLSKQLFHPFGILSKSRTTPPSTLVVRRRAKVGRPFGTTSLCRIRTSELSGEHWRALKVNPDRLWNDIHHTAQFGTGKRYGDGPYATGMSRLSLSNTDKQAREWFLSTTQSLSCTTHIDKMGNMFAIRPGRNSSSGQIPATFAGSHLDTQPAGGRFDGILGVCAGIEMLRVLEENWIETEAPVGVVNWTNEEGARFPVSMMGSGVWAGGAGLEKTWGIKEVASADGKEKKSVGDELQRIGFLGDVDASWESGVKMGGHFELHIEQGPHLVRSGEKVGVVEGVQAYKWFTITVEGRECHAGTTAFAHRADALWHAARMVVEVRGIAEREGGLASVGILRAEPGSTNTVPGLVSMSLDMRHFNDDALGRMVQGVAELANETMKDSTAEGAPGVKVRVEEDFDSRAIKFQPEAVGCVEAAARSVLGLRSDEAMEGSMRRMTSGAGHDSVHASKRCPTAMIFVPCKDGVSHHPEEWCEKEDCAIGAEVLLGAVLKFDKKRYDEGRLD